MSSGRRGIVVIGASGILGRALVEQLRSSWTVTATHYKNPVGQSVEYDLASLAPDTIPIDWTEQHAVVIAGGETSVDRCFRAPQESARINVDGSTRVMQHAEQFGVIPVLLSSDAVFRGVLEAGLPNPKTEATRADPGTEYGRQKLQLEQAQVQDGLTLRLSKVGDGFLDTIAARLKSGSSIRAAEDQFMSLVSAKDVARVVEWCLKNQATGLHHVAVPKVRSRFAWCRMLAEALAVDVSLVQPCSMDEFDVAGSNEFRARDCSIDGSALASRLPFSLQSGDEQVLRVAAR